MLEKVVAIIANKGSDHDVLLSQMDRVLKKDMKPATISGNMNRMYKMSVWDKLVLGVKPRIYTVGDDFEKAFVQDYKSWSGIILVIDGTGFDVETEDEDEYIFKASRELQKSGQLEVLDTFFKADREWKMPPVCIVATKGKKELQYEDAFLQVIKNKFSLFFNDVFSKKTQVSITAAFVRGNDKLNEEPVAKGVQVPAFVMLFSAILEITYDLRREWEGMLREYQNIHSIRWKTQSQKNRIEELETQQKPLHSLAYYLKKSYEFLAHHWDEDAMSDEPKKISSCRGYMLAMSVYYNFYDWEFSPKKQDHWNDMNID